MDKIILDIKKKLDSYTLPEGIEVIPPYVSIKSSKEELYTKYSSVVTTYNKICESLSKLQFMSVTIDRLMRELSNTKETFARQKFFSNELKTAKDEAKGLIDSYKYLKDGLEAAVRFYNSIQFILSSFRMNDV